MTFYETITNARTLLELPEEATRSQIKANYRRLLREWHPDHGKAARDVCEEKTRSIIEAYKVIMAYCDNYKYSFAQSEIRRYLPRNEWWMERFGQSGVSGKGPTE